MKIFLALFSVALLCACATDPGTPLKPSGECQITPSPVKNGMDYAKSKDPLYNPTCYGTIMQDGHCSGPQF